MSESAVGMSYLQELSPSISSGAGFDTHDYQSLLKGRGLLFADQKLIANEKTARLVRVYASMDQPFEWTLLGQWWRCQVLMFWLDLKVRSKAIAPWLWSDHNELLRSFFFHVSFSYVLYLIVDVVTSTFFACANFWVYIWRQWHRVDISHSDEPDKEKLHINVFWLLISFGI